MHKFFRHLIISTLVALVGVALYQAKIITHAAGSSTIITITGGAINYNDTYYGPSIIFESPVYSGDIATAYISASNITGNVSPYSDQTIFETDRLSGGLWGATITFGNVFETFTGTSLYIHVTITDSGGLNTGYTIQSIPFIANNTGSESQYSTLVISEIFTQSTGADDWVEIQSITGVDINLSGWTIDICDEGGVCANQPLMGTLPAFGLVVSRRGLTDSGGMVVIKDPEGNTGAMVSYNENSAYPGVPHAGYISTNQSAIQDQSGWTITNTPTLGRFNNAQTIGNCNDLLGELSSPPTLSSVDTCLTTMFGGIETNMGELTNPTDVPMSGDDALYFEKPGFGKIIFNDMLNLTDQNTTQLLQAIGNQLDMTTTGRIGFDASITGYTSTILQQADATLIMYNVNNFGIYGTVSASEIVALDSDTREILTGGSRPTIGDATYSSDSGGTLTFTTDHFTSFQIGELVGSFSFQDTDGYTNTTSITLNLLSSEAATYTISGDITSTVTGTTDGSGVATPTVTLTAGSGNKVIMVGFATGAKSSEIYSGSIILDTDAPTATGYYSTTTLTNQSVTAYITGFSESVTGLNTSDHTFTGNGSFTFTFEDAAGNTGEWTATVTWIDTTSPTASVVYDPASATNQDVLASLTGFSETITGQMTYNFTSNGGYTFTFWDVAGNTGTATATVTWIDKTNPTATIVYDTSGATNGDVIATITGRNETGVTITNNSTSPIYTFTGNGSFTFTFQDAAGNTGEATATVTWIDKIIPFVFLNGSGIINVEKGISYSELGAIWNDNVDGTGTVSTISGSVDANTLGTYIVEYIYVDSAGNTGTTTRTVNVVDTTAPTATVVYNTTGLTSSNVVAAITGFSESVTGLNASDHTFTGNGSFTFTFEDAAGNTGSAIATVTWIDTTAPTVTITSHTNNQQVTGGAITIAGTANDVNGITSVIVNGNTAAGTTSRNTTGVTLAGGDNTIIATGIDGANNPANDSINIVRVNYLSNVTDTLLSGTSVQIGFTTDISSQGFVNYGTTTGSLSTSVTGATATNHTITINGLTTDTTYYYQAYGINNGYTGNISSIGSFQTPSSIATNTIDGTTTATGSVLISGSTTTGATFESTGTLVVYGSTTSDYISLPVSGLVIVASGTWNGILEGPASTTFTGTAPTTTSYTHQPTLTYQIGSNSAALSLSGQTVTITINVGTSFNGKIMRIYKSSDAGVTYTFVNTCTVSVGLCSFTSDGFSLYTFLSQDNTSGGGSVGGGAGSLPKDSCPDGDFSSSFYDNTCGNKTTTNTTGNINNGSITGSPYPMEWNNAYLYAYNLGITTMNTIQQANMEGNLIRSHMAKMMVNYANEELGKYPDSTITCEFDDIANETEELQNYIKQACQMGLMGQGISNFDPNGEVTRAQFGTVLSRALYNDEYNNGEPYYLNHLNALANKGIITTTTPTLKEIRSYVMLMLMRAVNK